MAQFRLSSSDITQRERRTEEPAIKQEKDCGEKKTVPPCQVSSPRPCRLPLWELMLYLLIIIIFYTYVTYQLYSASQDFQRKTINGRGLLQPGWKILGERYQGIMPGEWSHWKFFTLHPTSLAIYVGHMTGGFLISKYLPNFRKGFLICSSLAGTAIIVSPPVFALLFFHAIIVYLVAVLGHRPWLIWIVVLSQLAVTVLRPFTPWQLSLLPDTREYRFKFITAMAFCCLRFITFGMGYLKQQEAREGSSEDDGNKDVGEVWTLWDYLLYVFYLPTIAHGPFMPPQGFFRQIKQPYHPSSFVEVRWVIIQWLRPIFCAFFLEFINHYIYFYSFLLLPQYLKTMPLLTLYALGRCCTILFQIQYMVYYGFARAMALFDGVLTPDLPACTHAMVTATHGWRYFDRGEYQFVLRNIYIPFGGSQHGSLRRSLALIICYSFVCFWHGFKYHVIVWVGILWVLVQLEAFSPIIAQKRGVQHVIDKLSPLTRRRLGCILSGGKYPIIVLAVIFFISNIEVGKIFLQRLIGGEGALWAITGVLALHYCHVQVIEECFSRWGRKYIMEKQYMAPPQL